MEMLVILSTCILTTFLCLGYVLNMLNTSVQQTLPHEITTWSKAYVVINEMSFIVYNCSIELFSLSMLSQVPYNKYNYTFLYHEGKLYLELVPRIYINIMRIKDGYEVNLNIFTPAPLLNNSYIQFLTDHLLIHFQGHTLLNLKNNNIFVTITYLGEPIWISQSP